MVEQFGKAKFPFDFTKFLKVNKDHEPAPIRVHVCVKGENIDGSAGFRGGFSFMLCGETNRAWDKEGVMRVLKEQGLFFSKHMVNMETQSFINEHWAEAETRCRMEVDKDGIRHVIVVVKATTVEEFGYNCIHSSSMQEEIANANSHYLWWLIRNEFLVTDGERGGDNIDKVRRTCRKVVEGDEECI